MYYYIYDIFISETIYKKQLLKLESTLTNLGIAGKVFKLNVLKNLEDIIEDAKENNIKNIIAVGNDQTLSKVANQIIDKDIVMGIIPFGENNIIAQALGIDDIEEACQIISARKVSQMDVGKINDNYFLLAAEPENNNIVCDFGKYKIRPKKTNETAAIYNINIDNKDFKSSPEDGMMEAVFTPKQEGWFKRWKKKETQPEENTLSVFPLTKMKINHTNKPIAINIDKQRIVKTPANIEVLPGRLKIIVGKQRIFA